MLENINSPKDLRALDINSLPILAEELRNFILDELSVNPGHVGSSLGAVELTIALHYIFNTPDDKLIWDVGHQAYAHKILTGRRDRFNTLRKLNGISGFPVMKESEYDAFGTGHSSTALSAALGMATADKLLGHKDRHHIAVVGDGAITGGMFFEALNHAGTADVDLLIILNDNGIAIDKSAGALKDYLLRQADKHNSTDFSNPLFEAFNIQCFGPVNGNDLNELLPMIEAVKKVNGVRLLHVLTTKGKGFWKAEHEQVLYHAPGRFDRVTGEVPHHQIPLYQDVFGETMLELAERNDKITVITPAMLTGSNLIPVMEKFPERTFDVSIAEQHAVTFAAGMAAEGMIPYCTVYSTFLQRAYDQIIHDVALQDLHVVFCIDRAGIVGRDGATHHGIFDLSYLNCVPNMIVAAPMNENELRDMLYTAQYVNCPISIRYPRGKATERHWKENFDKIEIGKARILKQGDDIAILSLGHTGNFVAKAAKTLEKEGINVTHIDMRFLKPLDDKILHQVLSEFKEVMTIEDGVLNGGFGCSIMRFVQEHKYNTHITMIGIPDCFVTHASPEELYSLYSMDDEGIVKKVKQILS